MHSNLNSQPNFSSILSLTGFWILFWMIAPTLAAEASNCSEHEFWFNGGNWCCPPTCKYPNNGIMCNCLGSGACTCVDGYIRMRSDGPCVPNEHCEYALLISSPSHCSKNEVFSKSESWCCENVKACNRQNEPCSEQCTNPTGECKLVCSKSGGCICAPGYTRVYATGPCIPRDKCCSKPNEIWEQCAHSICWQPTCKNPDPPCPVVINSTNCPFEGGCVCEPGFVRESSNGRCIKKAECREK